MPQAPRLSIPYTPDDVAVIDALKRVTGIQSTADVVRFAIREAYRSRSAQPWLGPQEPAKTGTDG